MMELKEKLSRFRDINWLVYALFVVFGMSSWVDTYGIWVEMPILVQNLPEGWQLPSYATVATQVANIAPLLYVAISSRFPRRRLEIPVSYAIIAIGTVSCVLLAFLWRETTEIAGAQRSTALLGLQFTLALVDTTSSVTYLPFLSIFRPQYVTSFFVGEGFSALVPSLIALIQGAGTMTCERVPISHTFNEVTEASVDFKNNGQFLGSFSTTSSSFVMQDKNTSTVSSIRPDVQTVQNFTFSAVYQEPKFSVQIFFFVLAVILVLSGISFTLLNFWGYCKKEYVTDSEQSVKKHFQETECMPLSYKPITVENKEKPLHTSHQPYVIDAETKDNTMAVEQKCDALKMKTTDNGECEEVKDPSNEKTMSTAKFWLFLILTAWLTSLIFGILPTIQSYSCLPYGTEPYHLTVTLTNIAHPLASFVSIFLEMKSLRRNLMMTFLATALSGYILWTAAASPEPPLVDHSAGPVILIICWVLASATINYTRVSIATACRSEGKMALMWVGAWTQIGGLLGSIVGFCLVNVAQVFQEANPCL